MKTHLLAFLIAIQLVPISFAQNQVPSPKTGGSNPPAELTPVYPREQQVNIATSNTSGSLMQRPIRPQAPPRPMLDSMARWREFDEKLLQSSRHYAENSARRNALMKSLAQTKDRASAEMDPVSIVARKEVERLLGELHTVIESDKSNDDQTMKLLRPALANRERWAGTLTNLLDQSIAKKDASAAERDRMRRWREGIARLQQNDSRDFIKQIVGNEYGDYLVNSNPSLARVREPDSGTRGLAEGEGRGFWLNRLAQLERTQASIRQQIDRQDQEITRLKMMLENRGPGRLEPPARDGDRPAQKPD